MYSIYNIPCVLYISEVTDLHKFVSVALHTAAGEGDLANDKLSHLKMIGSGYGPLIYDLNPSRHPSFEDFKNSCEKVWKALEQTPRLPELLVMLILYCIMV